MSCTGVIKFVFFNFICLHVLLYFTFTSHCAIIKRTKLKLLISGSESWSKWTVQSLFLLFWVNPWKRVFTQKVSNHRTKMFLILLKNSFFYNFKIMTKSINLKVIFPYMNQSRMNKFQFWQKLKDFTTHSSCTQLTMTATIHMRSPFLALWLQNFTQWPSGSDLGSWNQIQ